MANLLLELLDGFLSAATRPLDRMIERSTVIGKRLKENKQPLLSKGALKAGLTYFAPSDAESLTDQGWDHCFQAMSDAYCGFR
jgi:hypothetical protein